MTKLEEKVEKLELEKVVSYLSCDCPNCGRRRVELFKFTNGLLLDICEKCNWCIQYDNYISEEEKDRWLYD